VTAQDVNWLLPGDEPAPELQSELARRLDGTPASPSSLPRRALRAPRIGSRTGGRRPALADSELRIEVSLKGADMLFTNNRSVLHNDMTFEDHERTEQRRHLVRLWLRSRTVAAS